MLITVTIILLIAGFLVYQKFQKHPLDVFPEPPTNPIFGHVVEATTTKNIINNAKEFLKHGKTVRLRFGASIAPLRVGLFTEDYKLIQFVLNNNKILTKGENYKFLSGWLGKGLLLSSGDYWKRHRKILTPAFHFEILKEFVDIFETIGDVFVKKLHQHCGTSVDVYSLITLYTLDVICETAMGTKMNVQSGENSQYVNSVRRICQLITERTLSVFKIPPLTFLFSSDYYRQKKITKDLHNFTLGVINTKRSELKEDKGTKKKMAFLDLLLKFSKGEDTLTDNEIREEVDTFMFEGHDTTASAICFTLYCLAENPEIQEKVFQEQHDLFGNEKDPTIAYSDLQNMKYLENVIKETLRLYPSVPAIARLVTEPVKYENIILPKQTNIVLYFYGLHRNPEFFPDPEKFNPERFENIDGTLPYVYLPFSAGARNCIGQKFAMLELKSVVSKIVRHFKIKHTCPKHELKLAVEIVLKSLNGVKVIFEKRK